MNSQNQKTPATPNDSSSQAAEGGASRPEQFCAAPLLGVAVDSEKIVKRVIKQWQDAMIKIERESEVHPYTGEKSIESYKRKYPTISTLIRLDIGECPVSIAMWDQMLPNGRLKTLLDLWKSAGCPEIEWPGCSAIVRRCDDSQEIVKREFDDQDIAKLMAYSYYRGFNEALEKDAAEVNKNVIINNERARKMSEKAFIPFLPMVIQSRKELPSCNNVLPFLVPVDSRWI